MAKKVKNIITNNKYMNIKKDESSEIDESRDLSSEQAENSFEQIKAVANMKTKNRDHEGIRSIIFNSTLGKSIKRSLKFFHLPNSKLQITGSAFDELKSSFKNCSKNSPLMKMKSDISQEIDCFNNRGNDKLECPAHYNFRALILNADDTEKKNLAFCLKKLNEEEKSIQELSNYQ